MARRKISQAEFDEILRLHSLWLNGNPSGKRATFQFTDLRNVDLQGTDLRHADLQRTDLRRANLQGVNLQGADFRDAHLRAADFQNADLRGANLSWTDLRGALFNQAIPRVCWIESSVWLRSDIPWWLGHPQQSDVILRNR